MQLEWRISDPENRPVGLGDSVSSLFKRKKRKTVRPAVLDAPPPPPVSQLFGQEPGPARAPEPGGLPRFKATAADHIDRRRSDRFTAMRMRVRNAFTPSQPIVDGKMFAGRQDLLSHLIGSIEDQRLHLVLYGERGIGKTSLLHVLAEAARDARYIVVYSSCGAASSFQETFAAAAAEMPLLFHSGFGPTTEEAEAGSSMADLLPDNFTPRQFADLCAKLTGTRVLVFLDEFDRCESSDFRRDVAELMKFLSDRSVRVQLVIGGVAADLAELVEHIPSIRRNILAVRVPQMSDDEVRQMVARGERASGLAYDAAAQDLVVRIARGWPYIAVLVCHHAGLHALDVGRDVVLEDDISAALDTAIGEVRARMRKRIAGEPRQPAPEVRSRRKIGGGADGARQEPATERGVRNEADAELDGGGYHVALDVATPDRPFALNGRDGEDRNRGPQLVKLVLARFRRPSAECHVSPIVKRFHFQAVIP